MKRYLISVVAALVVLAVIWTAFGQQESSTTRPRRREGFGMFQMLSPEEAAKMREKWPNMSEEERGKFRAQMRERWENMSDEEKEKLRAQMRERFASRRRLGREEQLKAIKAIEAELAKLKAGIEATGPETRRRWQEFSEEERNKLRERFTKAREERQNALKTIIAQIAMLQGQRQPPAEGEELIIVNTGELNAIRELAVKEKAKETAQRLQRLGRGQRRFGPRPRPAGTTTTPRTPSRTLPRRQSGEQRQR